MSFNMRQDKEKLLDTLARINNSRGRGRVSDVWIPLNSNPLTGQVLIKLQYGDIVRTCHIINNGNSVKFCGTTRKIKES